MEAQQPPRDERCGTHQARRCQAVEGRGWEDSVGWKPFQVCFRQAHSFWLELETISSVFQAGSQLLA